MDLKRLLDEKGRGEIIALAKRAECSAGYLLQIAYTDRKPSPQLAKKLAGIDRRLTLEDLRPDIFGEPAL